MRLRTALPPPTGRPLGCTSGVAAGSESRTLRITATGPFSQLREGKAECLPRCRFHLPRKKQTQRLAKAVSVHLGGWSAGKKAALQWQTPYRLLQDPQLRQHHPPRTGLRNRAPRRRLSSPLSQWGGRSPGRVRIRASAAALTLFVVA